MAEGEDGWSCCQSVGAEGRGQRAGVNLTDLTMSRKAEKSEVPSTLCQAVSQHSRLARTACQRLRLRKLAPVQTHSGFYIPGEGGVGVGTQGHRTARAAGPLWGGGAPCRQSGVKEAVTAVIGDPQMGRREEPTRNCVIYVCGQRGKEVDAATLPATGQTDPVRSHQRLDGGGNAGEKGRSEGAPVAADVCRKTKGAPETTSSAPAEKRMRRP